MNSQARDILLCKCERNIVKKGKQCKWQNAERGHARDALELVFEVPGMLGVRRNQNYQNLKKNSDRNPNFALTNVIGVLCFYEYD